MNRRVLPFLFAAAIGPCAHAQLAPSAEPSGSAKPESHEKVEVTAPGVVDERRQSTAAKIVVNHDELVSHGDTTLLDAIKRLPGVTVSGQAGRNAEIRLRGLGNGYTQILLDGDPAPAGFTLETLDPDLIERIEIYRSATAELSTQSIAGTINIILRRKLSRRQRDLKLTWNRENARDSANLSAQVADKVGTLSYSLPFAMGSNRFRGTGVAEQQGTDSNGVPNLDYTTLQENRGVGQTLNFSPRLDWNLAKDDTFSWDSFLNYNRFHGNFNETSTTTLGEPPQYASSNLDFHVATYTLRSNLVWTQRMDNGAQLDARLGLSHAHRKSQAIFDAYDNDDVYILHRTVDGHATDDGLTTRGKYTLPFVPGHAFALGWDAAQSRRLEDRVQNDFTPTGLPQFNIDESYDARVLRAAFFSQDEWQLTDRLSAYLGLRWEGIDTKNIGNVVEEVHNRSGVWSPILQGVWKLPGTEKDQVRGGLARTYRAPTTVELIPRRFIANNNSATTPDFQGNPELQPELAWGLDIAYEHYFTGGGLFSVSGFARRIDNVILRDLNNVDGTFITRPANEGRATTHGIEFDTKANLRTFVAGAPSIDLRANLTLTDSKVDALPGPNNRLDAQTPVSGNVGFDYKLADAPLTVGGNFGYKGGGMVVLSPTQTKYTSATRTLDFYALWKLSPTMQLRATVSNALAQDALQVEGYHDASGALQLTTVSPTHPRAGLVLEMKL